MWWLWASLGREAGERLVMGHWGHQARAHRGTFPSFFPIVLALKISAAFSGELPSLQLCCGGWSAADDICCCKKAVLRSCRRGELGNEVHAEQELRETRARSPCPRRQRSRQGRLPCPHSCGSASPGATLHPSPAGTLTAPLPGLASVCSLHLADPTDFGWCKLGELQLPGCRMCLPSGREGDVGTGALGTAGGPVARLRPAAPGTACCHHVSPSVSGHPWRFGRTRCSAFSPFPFSFAHFIAAVQELVSDIC